MYDDLQSVGVGLCIGFLVILVLSAFPGEPLDYNDDVDQRQIKKNAASSESQVNEIMRIAQVHEVELAAKQIKVDKLQQLLGLEKHKVNEMIKEAKADAFVGRESNTAMNYAKLLDGAFYSLIFGLMVVVLQAEYNIDVLQIANNLFPREVATVHKIFEVSKRYIVSWGINTTY